VRILDFSERGQARKTEFVEACDFMGIKPENSSWNHGFWDHTDKERIAVQGVFTQRVVAKEVLEPCTSARPWLDIALEEFCPAPARTFLSASRLTDLRERTRMSALQLPRVVVLERSKGQRTSPGNPQMLSFPFFCLQYFCLIVPSSIVLSNVSPPEGRANDYGHKGQTKHRQKHYRQKNWKGSVC